MDKSEQLTINNSVYPTLLAKDVSAYTFGGAIRAINHDLELGNVPNSTLTKVSDDIIKANQGNIADMDLISWLICESNVNVGEFVKQTGQSRNWFYAIRKWLTNGKFKEVNDKNVIDLTRVKLSVAITVTNFALKYKNELK